MSRSKIQGGNPRQESLETNREDEVPEKTGHDRRPFNKILLLIAATFALSSWAMADTTYVYVGQPFENFFGGSSCPPQCSITGDFTIPTLPPNMPVTTISPTTFSFTDGLYVWDPANSSALRFSIGTGPWDQISYWEIELLDGQIEVYSNGHPGNPRLGTEDSSSNNTLVYPARGEAWVNSNPGTWTSNALTPEPGTLILITSGALLGTGSWVRRRKRLGKSHCGTSLQQETPPAK
jgi:hypothetical protein